jgi:rubrerythrin
MNGLPRQMPRDGMNAYAYFLTVTHPSIDDLKGMMFLEASGQGLYDGLAALTDKEEAREILARNGREERAHAHRLRRAIRVLSGEIVAVPAPQDNPYHGALGFDALTTKVLEGLVGAELDGENLYNIWADGVGNDDAARLLRQNGREERRHGERVRKVMSLLQR